MFGTFNYITHIPKHCSANRVKYVRIIPTGNTILYQHTISVLTNMQLYVVPRVLLVVLMASMVAFGL